VVIEIPMLELACSLPPWDELVAISDACRSRDVVLHADDARLWEVARHYQRSYRQIAALFDSLYVSFYKGLNATAGGALLVDAVFVERARI
jgi:threonine aldolase